MLNGLLLGWGGAADRDFLNGRCCVFFSIDSTGSGHHPEMLLSASCRQQFIWEGWGVGVLREPGQFRKLVSQSCRTLCDPMDCSPPGSSVHGILQARMLEWVAILLSRGSSRPRDRTWFSCISGRFFTDWATRETNNFEKRLWGTGNLSFWF